MSHYLFNVTSEAPAPAAGNDMGSWFRHYKWEVDDEAFVPIHEPARKHFLGAREGDLIWFSVDRVVIGCATITRLEDEIAQRKIEVWYDAQKRQLAPEGIRADLWTTGELPGEVGEEWAGRLKRTL
jgi:hypothetical protein